MAKDLRTFIADCQRELPGEVIHITKEVNPANYDVTAIIKHLGAQKKFPIIIFDKPLNLERQSRPDQADDELRNFAGQDPDRSGYAA